MSFEIVDWEGDETELVHWFLLTDETDLLLEFDKLSYRQLAEVRGILDGRVRHPQSTPPAAFHSLQMRWCVLDAVLFEKLMEGLTWKEISRLVVNKKSKDFMSW